MKKDSHLLQGTLITSTRNARPVPATASATTAVFDEVGVVCSLSCLLCLFLLCAGDVVEGCPDVVFAEEGSAAAAVVIPAVSCFPLPGAFSMPVFSATSPVGASL